MSVGLWDGVESCRSNWEFRVERYFLKNILNEPANEVGGEGRLKKSRRAESIEK